MPSIESFKNKKEYLDYYRKYRAKNREAFRIYNRYYNKKWRAENGYHNEENSKKRYPERQKARMKLRYAVSVGKIQKKPCIKCGNEKSQAHHKDYNKPLDVIWVCALHHSELHNKHR